MANQMHIANYQDAPRFSCIASTAMGLCEVIKITTGAVTGQRYAARVTVAADVQARALWGVALKISADPFQVSTSSVALTVAGDRRVAISSGDQMVQVGAGAVIEIDAALLHSSLDPDRAGSTPAVGASLGVNTSGTTALFSTAAQTSLTNVGTTIHIARVYRTFGKKVLIQLTEA